MNEKLNDLLKKVRATATVAGDYATKTANSAGKKASEMFHISKINLRIFDLNTDMDVILKEIGQIIYHSHINLETSAEELEAKLNEADEKMAQIEELKAQISALKDIKVCSGCENICNRSDKFCPKCGADLD